VEDWDSSLVAQVQRWSALCREHSIEFDASGLPQGVQRLLALAEAVPEQAPAVAGPKPSWLELVGAAALSAWHETRELLDFLGRVTSAFGRWLTLRARMRRSDVLLFVQHSGADALPIVTLISLLVGLIMGFVGAVQLGRFGAGIYVADLVAVATVREMGAMMTGILMAGRTGSAFAAQLGTMKVTEEIDALTTFGIPPIDFLVLPRMLALCAMMPLLCIYSDLLGIIGGAFVGVGLLHISPEAYWHQTVEAIAVEDVLGGLVRSAVYGVLVAIAGCMAGMRAGNSASAVGDAATRAVVTGIVAIVVADGILAVLSNVLGI
jgi:phospholipid/cholesterol/gamma-HCH transport system permease protein